MSESKLREISTDFAVKVIKLCETIKGHDSLVNQLECSTTSNTALEDYLLNRQE